MCNPGRIGVITSPRTFGFQCDLRVQIYQGPDTISGSKGIPHILTRLQGPISKTSGFQLRSPDLSYNPRIPTPPLGSSLGPMI
ncbi:hypothetical protein F2Q68_00021063 [Brassica cretica]|uniref:Uncharacterized protein n=1 Tax=Brassica cretica TaxID=69181 RepID=A0A8S9FSA3_BRACR|nr:hypothetical protein F2Q68_00021063 [Brassica cretica]